MTPLHVNAKKKKASNIIEQAIGKGKQNKAYHLPCSLMWLDVYSMCAVYSQEVNSKIKPVSKIKSKPSGAYFLQLKRKRTTKYCV